METHHPAERTDLIKAAGEQILRHLEERKQQIIAEIRNYPPPIPACDQQFNYLLEQRAGIAGELDRLHEALQRSQTDSDAWKFIAEFLRSSQFVDHQVRQSIPNRVGE